MSTLAIKSYTNYFGLMKNIAPHDMLCFALYSTANAMQQTYKPLLEPLGLTYPQYLVMSTLWVKDGLTVGDIGDEMLLESNTLTPMLKKLETRGLITRQRDPEDERQVRIRLTAEGRKLQEEAQSVASCFLEKTCLSIEDAIRMRDGINSLRQRLKQ